MKLCAALIVACCVMGTSQAKYSLSGNIRDVVTLLSARIYGQAQAQYATWICHMMPNPSLSPNDRLYQNIAGTVTFSQATSNSTTIDINLRGFNTTDGLMYHGFHVHQAGDISAGCEGAEGHFNPGSNKHGAPTGVIRHVGDLGNIKEDASGNVVTQKIDSVIKFDGTNDITGRAIVVHETFDDLGLGNHPDSSTTGHAGARLACCVIAVGGAGGGGGSSAAFPLANYTMVVTFALITCVFALLRLD